MTDRAQRVVTLRTIAEILVERFDDRAGAIPLLLEAFFEDPRDDDTVRALEVVARAADRFGELLSAVNGWIAEPTRLRSADDRIILMLRAAKWYGEDAGRPEWAAAYLDEARAIAPADVRVARAWARLVATTGPLDAVEAARRRVLELDPTDLEALDGLERILRGRGALAEYVAFLEARVAGSVFASVNPVRLRLSALYEELGAAPRALSILEEAYAADRSDKAILRALEAAYDVRGMRPELLRILDARRLHDDGVDPVAIVLRIAALLEDEFLDPERAIRRLEDLLGEAPECVPAYVALARCYGKVRRWHDALAVLEWELAVVTDPEPRVEACAAIAKILLDEIDDPARAVEACQRGLAIDPDAVALFELAARAHERIGDLPRALSASLEAARRAQDRRADALVLVAASYRTRLADPRSARAIYREALDEDPTHLGALAASRALAVEREDFAEAATLLDREQRHHPNPLARAKLLVELGNLRRDRLDDPHAAQHAFEEANVLDPDNVDAALALAEIHVEATAWEDARPLLGPLVRLARSAIEQGRVLVLLGRSCAGMGDHEEAFDALRRAVRLGETTVDVLRDLVESGVAVGELIESLSAQKTIVAALARTGAPVEARAACATRLGEIKLGLGDLRGARRAFEEVLALLPNDRRTIEGILAIAIQLEEWDSVASWEARLLELVDDGRDRRSILRQSATRWAEQACDLRRAAARLEDLLALDPTDRQLLHELLRLRQELADWPALIAVIGRIVALDADPSRRAKYLIAAAKVARDELEDRDRAVDLLDRALDEDPRALEAFQAIEAVLVKARDFRRLERAYRKMILRARPLGDADLEFRLWHALGLIYRDRLGDAASSVEAFRMASRIRPEDSQERQIVAELYEAVERTDLAIAELQEAIASEPLEITHHQALHAIWTRRGDLERAHVSASILVLLGAATDDQRREYDAHRPKGMPAFAGSLGRGTWARLVAHPELETGVSAIFAAVARAARVAKARGQVLPRGSLPPSRREDRTAPSHAAAKVFFRVADVLGVEPPELYLRTDLPGAITVVARDQATSVMGSSLLGGFTEAELAFVAGKHLASITDAHELRAHFRSKSELRAILLAALSIGLRREVVDRASTAPLAADVARIAKAIDRELHDDERALLVRTAAGFADTSGRADVARWMQCSELTALRAALLVCGDLPTAAKIVRLEPVVAGDLSPAEKIRDLVRFATSDRYHELRRALGVDATTTPPARRGAKMCA
jgi:tetratricopeptide (TPR) repeat protein